MMKGPSRIPPGALTGLEDWEATVVWSYVPEVVTWRLVAPTREVSYPVRYLKVSRRGQELALSDERDRMLWAATRLPVPRVLDFRSDGEHEWLLTAGLDGVNAIDDRLRADPPTLVPLLAAGLRQLHAVPIADCPFDSRPDLLVRVAHERVAAGLVDADRDLHPEHGRLTAETALARLAQLRPLQEDLVLCHGDYCLPNVLIDGGRVSGFVDLGKVGVADRWWDLAVATQSVTRNLGPGWEDVFLDAYGVRRDSDRIAFYRLLYDLVP